MTDITTRDGHGRRTSADRLGRHHHHQPPGERQIGRGRGRRHGGRADRAQRGDVRAAVLLLLTEGPKHGYQLMQEIGRRTEGGWRPSPGAIYPTISLLKDEGLVELTKESDRQLVTLTDAGKAFVDEHRESLGDPFTPRTRGGGSALRDLMEELHLASRQVARTGSDAQVEATRRVLAEARRSVYLILADDPGEESS